MEQAPLISVIVPTVGRESLERAVDSVLDQELQSGEIEVIVVNDSGAELKRSSSLLKDRRVTVIATNRRRQSVARNTGAAIARGHNLLFLDDDDYLAPRALASLLEILDSQPQFIVAYGSVALENKAGKTLGVLNLGVSGNCASHMLAGALILFGSALIQTEAFFNAGGIDSTLTTSEEIEFFRRLAMMGDFGNTSAVILRVLRGEGWASSLDYGPAVAILRASREQILDQKGAFARLSQSASKPYWRGRNVKAYLASVLWNMKAKRLLNAASRLINATLALIFGGSAIFHPGFWRAQRDSQVPATMHRVLDSIKNKPID